MVEREEAEHSGSERIVLVELEPVGRRVRVTSGHSVLAACRAAGVELVAVCGGIGSCDTCRVQRIDGVLSEPTLTETSTFSLPELHEGFRLACQADVLSDVRIAIPEESLATPQRLQLEGEQAYVEPGSPVDALDIELPAESVRGAIDIEILLRTARARYSSHAFQLVPEVSADLSGQLLEQDGRVRLAVHHHDGVDEVVGLLSPADRTLGLALDLGTTKLAGYLVDLESGHTVARAGAPNPQISFGEDVVSRIAHANRSDDHREALQIVLVEAVDALAGRLCVEAGAKRHQIVDIAAVGNTAMHHLFAGLPVRQLGERPYLPATTDPVECRAQSLGLNVAPGAYTYLAPSVAGYVGADHLAMLLATGVWQSDRRIVALDVGTNTEITVVNRGTLFSCSCASGPAFEGAHIRDGMRAMPGAIERVRVADGRMNVHSIGDEPPIGLCGSGILDAVAAMRGEGILDERGAVLTGVGEVRDLAGIAEYVLVDAGHTAHGRDIVVTRKDVHEIQLAKAAIRAGVEVLLHEAELEAADIDEFVVAGAFGTYLDLSSAVGLGMFPDIPLERFRQVGNAAGMGALQLLLSVERRDTVAEIGRKIRYVELTNHPRFSDEFVEGLILARR